MSISFLMPLLVTFAGGYLLFKLRFFFILHPVRTIKSFFYELGERDSRRSLCLALAGTLGVGNIFGVAAGIMLGGAGSIFWMLVSSLFAMIIKYAETLLVFDTPNMRGGMSSALTCIFPIAARVLSPIYAGLTVLLSLFMGGAMQSAAVIDVAEKTLSAHPAICSLIFFVLFIPCLFGSTRRIENITEFLIPLTTVIYIFLSFLVIFLNFEKLPDTVENIFRSAFTPRAAAGGVLSSLPMLAIKEGFARGILSNEAGVGSSALAHSRAAARTPHIAGLFGMSEVVFDTSLLCSLTGLAILTSLPDPTAYASPMSLVTAAYSEALGDFAGYLLLLLVLAFAYSTVICWYFYGTECITFAFPKLSRPYPILFSLSLLLSFVASAELLLAVTDTVLFFMALITLSAIVKKSDRIRELADI